MFKISEIHDTFSESTADSTLRKSLSMGDMELDGGAGGQGGDDNLAGTQIGGGGGAKIKRKSGEKDEEDDEATLRDATEDTSESTLPLNVAPNPTPIGAESNPREDLPLSNAPPPPQRPPLVHAATVATPARLRPRLSRQKSFEIDSESDEVQSSTRVGVSGQGERMKTVTLAALDNKAERDPSGPDDASERKSAARREDATREAKRSSGDRAKADGSARLKDKESSGEDPKSGKRPKMQGDKSKSGKSRRGSSSGNRGAKRGGEGNQLTGFHSNTLPNPKKHHCKKKRNPGLTITIDNLKESFDGCDKVVKTDADILQHSPNFCIRCGPMRSEWVNCYEIFNLRTSC